MTTQPFQENKRSFCTRLITDLEQMKYIADLIKFSNEPARVRFHLSSIETYLEKVREHLISIERVIP